jgi:anti-sigma factor RsiW
MRDSPDRTQASSHEQCWELLPWLVNGTLDKAQVQRIEQHVAECPACRDELASQSQLREHMQSDEAVLRAPHASLQKLLAKIDRDEEQAAEPAFASVARRPRRMDKSRWLAVAVVAEAACLIMLIGTLSWKIGEGRAAPRYSTLTSPSEVSLAQPAARVVFAPTVSVAELNGLLHSYDARIVAGPTETGVFTVALPATLSEAEVASAIERMQRDARVRFAQPAPSPGNAR